jgi:hypothetical protein
MSILKNLNEPLAKQNEAIIKNTNPGIKGVT